MAMRSRSLLLTLWSSIRGQGCSGLGGAALCSSGRGVGCNQPIVSGQVCATVILSTRRSIPMNDEAGPTE